jgi:hypothetical protein
MLSRMVAAGRPETSTRRVGRMLRGAGDTPMLHLRRAPLHTRFPTAADGSDGPGRPTGADRGDLGRRLGKRECPFGQRASLGGVAGGPFFGPNGSFR